MKKWLFALIMAFALNTVFASNDLEWAKKRLQPLISLSQDPDFQHARQQAIRTGKKISGKEADKAKEALIRSFKAVENDFEKLKFNNKNEEIRAMRKAILYNLLVIKTFALYIDPTNNHEEVAIRSLMDIEKKNENTLLPQNDFSVFQSMLFLGETANSEQEKREIYNEVIRFFVNLDYLKYDEPLAQDIAITIMTQHRDLLAKPKMEKLCNYCKSNSNKCDAKEFGSFVFEKTILQRCQSGAAMERINSVLYEH